MLELVSGFLDRFELALVLGVGAVHFAMTALFAYTLQAISDKTDAAPAWMSWVPFVQMHPFIRAAGTTWTALLVWIALMIAVTVLAVMASSSSYAGHAQFAGVLLTLGSMFYFGRMMWRLAQNRDLSGFVGLVCLIPFIGLPFYFYIAFHDGLVRPSAVGLGVALVLAIVSATGFQSDLSELRAVLGTGAALFDSAGLQISMDSGDPGELAAAFGAAADSGSEQGLASAALGSMSLGPDAAKRIYYQFIDDRGSVRFVERLDQVPPDWRDRVGYVEIDGPPPGSLTGASATGSTRTAAASRGARATGVLLYYADWCGYCRKTSAELDRRGVSYERLNIDKPTILAELVEKTGQRNIPVVDVGGKILIGYDPQGLDELLNPAS